MLQKQSNKNQKNFAGIRLDLILSLNAGERIQIKDTLRFLLSFPFLLNRLVKSLGAVNMRMLLTNHAGNRIRTYVFRNRKIYKYYVILRNMEIIGKISRGSKMDQVYLSKNRAGFAVGNYVIIKPLEERTKEIKSIEKLYFYGIKGIEPVKLEIVNKIMKIISRLTYNYDNIFITGSFLDEGFQFNDIDILILTEKETENTLKRELENQIGMKTHIIFFNKSSLKKALEIDPIWRLMLSRCISKKRLLPHPRKNIDYKYLDAQLIKSKALFENFDILNGKEKYKLIRNIISIYLFVKNKEISESNIEKETKEKLGIDSDELKNNIVDKGALKRYRNFYFKMEEDIIKNAAKQEKTN